MNLTFTLSAAEAFRIGNLSIEWYGIILTGAMLSCLVYAIFECPRIGLTKDDALELFLWIIPLAIVFARFIYVIVRPEEYFPWHSWSDFVHAIAIWEGGITIIGGLLGGILGGVIFWFRHRDKCTIPQLIDMIAPTLLLAQSLGRWGNFVNQEAYGLAIPQGFPTGLPFSVYIDHCGSSLCNCGGVGGWHYATFLYEAIWNFVGAIIFYVIWRKNKKFPGILGFLYLFWYNLIRALLEYLRIDAVPETQILCYTIFPIALVLGIVYVVLKSIHDKVKKKIDLGEEIDESKAEYKIYKFVAFVWKKISLNTIGKPVENQDAVAISEMNGKIVKEYASYLDMKADEERFRLEIAEKNRIAVEEARRAAIKAEAERIEKEKQDKANKKNKSVKR